MTTRPLLPVLAFALLAFVGDGDLVSGARATERLAPPASFRNLRVCSYGAFSRAQDRCTKDERGVVLVSNRISCSVDIIVRKTAVLRSQMTYLGQTISFGPATFYPSRSAQRWWIDLNLRAALPLPGGSWSCRFSMGSARVGASFESGGPTGEIVDTAACRGADTVRFGSGRACLTDESSSPIPPTDSLWCYAVYPSDTGREAKIDLDYGTLTLQSTSFSIGGPMWSGWVHLDDIPGQKFVPGSYTCRFSLDGKVVSEKPFELSPS